MMPFRTIRKLRQEANLKQPSVFLLLFLNLLAAAEAHDDSRTSQTPKDSSQNVSNMTLSGKFEFDASVESVPLATSNLLWVFDTQGRLHLIQKDSKKVRKAFELIGCCKAALSKSRGGNDEPTVIAADSEGNYYLFDASGKLLKHGTAHGGYDSTFLLAAPVILDSGNKQRVFLVSDGGVPYLLTERSLQLFGKDPQPCGTMTSSPVALSSGPTLFYVTRLSNEAGVGANFLNVVSEAQTRTIRLGPFSANNPDGCVSFQPTTTRIQGKETVLLIKDNGKVLMADTEGTLQHVVNLECSPTCPIAELNSNRFAVFGVGIKDRLTKAFIFSGDGKVEESVLKEPSLTSCTIAAVPTSYPVFVSRDACSNSKDIAIMGFSDNFVRAVDIKTGMEIARFRTQMPVEMQPLKLDEREIFLVERSDLNSVTPKTPNGLGRAFLVKLELSPQ